MRGPHPATSRSRHANWPRAANNSQRSTYTRIERWSLSAGVKSPQTCCRVASLGFVGRTAARAVARLAKGALRSSLHSSASLAAAHPAPGTQQVNACPGNAGSSAAAGSDIVATARAMFATSMVRRRAPKSWGDDVEARSRARLISITGHAMWIPRVQQSDSARIFTSDRQDR